MLCVPKWYIIILLCGVRSSAPWRMLCAQVQKIMSPSIWKIFQAALVFAIVWVSTSSELITTSSFKCSMAVVLMGVCGGHTHWVFLPSALTSTIVTGTQRLPVDTWVQNKSSQMLNNNRVPAKHTTSIIRTYYIIVGKTFLVHIKGLEMERLRNIRISLHWLVYIYQVVAVN